MQKHPRGIPREAAHKGADGLLQNIISPVFIFQFVAVVVSLTVHEFAHAWTADRLGDRTPRVAGRVTLNPVAHLEPLGLIMILFAPIGWAKPVPLNGANFRHPRRSLLLVAAAGPVANLILAAICVTLLRFVPPPTSFGASVNDFLLQLLRWGFIVNVSLFVFNLIPIPPLDGSRIVASLLPSRLAYSYSRLELYGPFILFLFVLIPPLRNQIFLPLFATALNWVASWLALAPWMV